MLSVLVPFGLNMSPRTFTKVMREVLRHWRASQVLVLIFLDDIIVMAPTREALLASMGRVWEDLKRLGLKVNLAKSHWEPMQRGEWLGMWIDTVEGTFSITEHQLNKLEAELRQFLKEASTDPAMTARLLAKLAGRIVCWARALTPARLMTRELYACLEQINGNYNRKVLVSEQAVADMRWLLENLRAWNGRSMWKRSHIKTLTTDISDTHWAGWAVSPKTGQLLEVRGLLKPEEQLTPDGKPTSTTLRELLGFRYVLREVADHFQGHTLQLRGDNAGSISNVQRQGAGNCEMWVVVRSIWELAMANNIELTDPKWIPREQNVLADRSSKKDADTGDSVRDGMQPVGPADGGPLCEPRQQEGAGIQLALVRARGDRGGHVHGGLGGRAQLASATLRGDQLVSAASGGVSGGGGAGGAALGGAAVVATAAAAGGRGRGGGVAGRRALQHGTQQGELQASFSTLPLLAEYFLIWRLNKADSNDHKRPLAPSCRANHGITGATAIAQVLLNTVFECDTGNAVKSLGACFSAVQATKMRAKTDFDIHNPCSCTDRTICRVVVYLFVFFVTHK